ncbi:MAG: hypothetical protein K9J06_09930 [Flavobacteriales bacterium]|nr:hypothetical protein [Flavobacteriales bacterium]
MRLLKPILSLILAVLVLLSGMGFFVDHMVCSISGRHLLAINTQVEHCSDSCERPTEGHSVSKECCQYDSNYFKEDILNQQKDEREMVIFSAFHFIPVQVFIAETLPIGEAALPRFPDLPPPPSVRMHVLHQVFLV